MEKFNTSSTYCAAKRAKPDEAAKYKASSSRSACAHKDKAPSSPELAAVGIVAAAYVMPEETNILDCGVCCFPLKAPIFQCDEGHAICSSCRDKLAPSGKCHVCSIPIVTYHRCRTMENLVESIRVPCPYAVHGWVAMPAYCDAQDHSCFCPHAPLHCPGINCGFLAPTIDELLDHFAGVHRRWPPTTRIRAGKAFAVVRLHDGFNLVLATTGDDAYDVAGRVYLFMMYVTKVSDGRAVTVHFIGRKLAEEGLTCSVMHTRHLYAGGGQRESRKRLGSHHRQTDINVECTADLSRGLPHPEDCIPFMVPDYVLGEDHKDDATVKVKVRVSITDAE
ncbi:hypothetical protein HU200_007943 [Digitaria exilis]|uniref:RING-type E3 ubiquitin transferase n=1 Tax=Digitaria exilis TaxID=1010633 RepID=A0A835FPD1_9POAL|nr:hypothetical protein HU200_007943 [Digitaria exilis]